MSADGIFGRSSHQPPASRHQPGGPGSTIDRMATTTAVPPLDGHPFPPLSAVVLASPEGRAPGVLDRPHRIALADRISGLIAEADRFRPATAARPTRPTPPPCPTREQVVAARGRLLDLEHALRAGIPLPRHGEHLVEALLDAAEAGAYAEQPACALHDDAETACLAVGSVSPFH